MIILLHHVNRVNQNVDRAPLFSAFPPFRNFSANLRPQATRPLHTIITDPENSAALLGNCSKVSQWYVPFSAFPR